MPRESHAPHRSGTVITEDSHLLARKGAEVFLAAAESSVNEMGSFSVALSGGATPRPMHRLLAEGPFCSAVPWDKIRIFWVDERCVPADDPASNYGSAKMDLLDRIPLRAGQVHPMPGTMDPGEAALRYEKELAACFGLRHGELPAFDLIYLGVGRDGHVASLFPGQEALNEQERWVLPVKGGDPNWDRLTLTYPVLNRGRRIVFMVSGKEKAPIVKAMLEQGGTDLPARRIRPVTGELLWLLDRGSASLLSGAATYEDQ